MSLAGGCAGVLPPLDAAKVTTLTGRVLANAVGSQGLCMYDLEDARRPGSSGAGEGGGDGEAGAPGAFNQDGQGAVVVRGEPPHLAVEGLPCEFDTTAHGGGWKVQTTSCDEGAMRVTIQSGQVTKIKTGYKIVLELLRTGKVGGRPVRETSILKIDASR